MWPEGFMKTRTCTCKNPHPWLWVRVSVGMGVGCQKKPQGYPWQSLIALTFRDSEEAKEHEAIAMGSLNVIVNVTNT